MSDVKDELLRHAVAAAERYLHDIGDRPVGATMATDDLRRALDVTLTAGGEAPTAVLDALAALAPTATVASAGPRYFGFVTGGTLPAARAADVLTTARDQNTAMAVMSPLAAVVEEAAGRWLVDLLGLPPGTSFGFVTGSQSANTTCLAVARHHVLCEAGWDVERQGLQGAPRVTVVVGAERHATIAAALRFLGLGAPTVVVDADDQGRMRPDRLAAALRDTSGPLIVCAQVGNVTSGAADPVGELARSTHDAGGWLHVDGAFGAWAAASPTRRRLTAGMAQADSWGVDGHKMLNVPYDCGYAFTAHPASHRAACGSRASYYVLGDDLRDGATWVLDASRRARGVATYVALRTLGRAGVADLVDRCCDHVRRFAAAVGDEPGVEVLNDVVFNQVAVRFADDDATTDRVIAAVQDDGTCWAGGATWRGRRVMRWSVANWSTTEDDIDRSADAVVEAFRSLDRD